MNVETKETLQAQIQTLRGRLNKIEAAETNEKNAALIGKAFRYRNCYSCPKDERDYWWIYRLVVGVADYGVSVRDFWIDRDGRVGMEVTTDSGSLGGWQPMSLRDYRAALRRFRQNASAWLEKTENTL